MNTQFEKVNCSRGAPMGRTAVAVLHIETPKSVALFTVKLDAGGYDDGGAYWGRGTRGERLYCAEDERGGRRFTRATTREKAALMLGLSSSSLKKGLVEPLRYGIDILDGRAPMPAGMTKQAVVAWMQANGAAMGQQR